MHAELLIWHLTAEFSRELLNKNRHTVHVGDTGHIGYHHPGAVEELEQFRFLRNMKIWIGFDCYELPLLAKDYLIILCVLHIHIRLLLFVHDAEF